MFLAANDGIDQKYIYSSSAHQLFTYTKFKDLLVSFEILILKETYLIKFL